MASCLEYAWLPRTCACLRIARMPACAAHTCLACFAALHLPTIAALPTYTACPPPHPMHAALPALPTYLPRAQLPWRTSRRTLATASCRAPSGSSTCLSGSRCELAPAGLLFAWLGPLACTAACAPLWSASWAPDLERPASRCAGMLVHCHVSTDPACTLRALQAGLAGLSFDEGQFGVVGYVVKVSMQHSWGSPLPHMLPLSTRWFDFFGACPPPCCRLPVAA